MSKTIDLYGTLPSPACRAVLLTGKALNVNINLIPVNMAEGEHLKPEYLKLNPQHTIPTLVDDGFVLCESRAIMRYLANKYAKNSPLYPEDPKIRAQIDQKLDFDIGTLYKNFTIYFYPQLKQKKPADPAALAVLHESLDLVNTFLELQKFVVGSNLTLADLAIVVTVSTIELTANNILEGYPYIQKWLSLVSAIAPGYEEINIKGLTIIKETILAKQ